MALSLELGKSVRLHVAAPGNRRRSLLALGMRGRLSSAASVARGFGLVCRERAVKAGIKHLRMPVELALPPGGRGAGGAPDLNSSSSVVRDTEKFSAVSSRVMGLKG